MNGKQPRCAIYARYSTEMQNESTLEDQRRVCTDHARRLGYTVTATYEDAAISGGAIGNRPGFIAMREAAEAKEFEALLVMDMSRLSRNQGDLAKSVEWLVFNDVRVVGVHDGVDTERDGWESTVGVTGIVGEQFRKMIAKKTYAALASRAAQGKPTGGRAYGYDCADGARAINAEQAQVVRRIFERFAEGASCRTIAQELNEAQVASPGSTWSRKTRRCEGWAGSGVHVILENPIYTGTVRWNVSRWVKHPNTGAMERRERPPEEWREHQDESLRIVSDQLWQTAQARSKGRSNPSLKLKRGGKARYLLSGLLKCGVCGRNFCGWGATHYRCGGYIDGRACSNDLGMHRQRGESLILRPVLDELLEPTRVAMLAREFQRDAEAALRAKVERGREAPAELRALDERIARLQARLAAGDPDLTTDELQAAIATARAKRQALLEVQPAARVTAGIARIVPDAARRYRTAIERAMAGGDVAATAEAREMIRTGVLVDGEIKLVPEGGKLYAEYGLMIRPELVHQRLALQRATGTDGLAYFSEDQELRTCGSGGRI